MIKDLKIEPKIPHSTALVTTFAGKRWLVIEDRESHLLIKNGQETILIPRIQATTPVVVCRLCGAPVVERNNNKLACCPHYDDHRFRQMLNQSIDKRFNRKMRRKFRRQAVHIANIKKRNN